MTEIRCAMTELRRIIKTIKKLLKILYLNLKSYNFIIQTYPKKEILF